MNDGEIYIGRKHWKRVIILDTATYAVTVWDVEKEQKFTIEVELFHQLFRPERRQRNHLPDNLFEI